MARLKKEKKKDILYLGGVCLPEDEIVGKDLKGFFRDFWKYLKGWTRK